MNDYPQVIAVVVTFNRESLLKECLAALDDQTRKPDRILLVDNASTDGTAQTSASWEEADPRRHKYVRLDHNTGGAGGFARGLELGMEDEPAWLWIMDDDAKPLPGALEALMTAATSPDDVYGSLAVAGTSTSWTTTLINESNKHTEVDDASEVPPISMVVSLPFLGFMIHSTLVHRIGLPDAAYFIAGDDIEYCHRVKASGGRLFIVGTSLIEHPKAQRDHLRILGFRITYLSLPPWKRYYDTRNRILTAKKHAGGTSFALVLVATLLRFAVALLREPRRGAQARSFGAGLLDGALGRTGKRHEHWKLDA